jgi:hypothetical protein
MHEMDWQRLERLTVDLFGYEPDIATSDDHGTTGQTDHGVDVIARRRGNDGEEVASCKKTDEIDAADLIKWSGDFLKHWTANWSKRDIRRFVLATTARNTGDRHIQNQVTAERARFQALGVEYELWGPKQFVHKLRPHRSIAVRYVGEPWAEIICGPAAGFSMQSAPVGGVLSAAVVAQLGELQSTLSGQIAKRAESALNDLRSGRVEAVGPLIDELREPSVWNNLQPEAQAKILRLAASLSIRSGRLVEAEAFATEADAIHPAEEPRIAAHLALERDGVDAAIQVLGEPISLAGKQLLGSLLLMKGEVESLALTVEELESEDADDPETLRLSAYLKLCRNDRGSALDQVRRAEALAGEWTAVMQAGVIIRYAQALSPAVGREWLFFPNPLEISLVKQDDAVQPLLAQALELTDRLEATGAPNTDASLWRLAILANRRDGVAEASDYARALLANDLGQPTVIGWCLTRRLDVDLLPSLAFLKDQYRGGVDVYDARILGLALTVLEEENVAARFLREHLAIQPEATRREAELWISRLEGRAGSGTEDAVPDALRTAQSTGNWLPISQLLQQAFVTTPPVPTALMLVQAIADFGRWGMLDGFVDRILEFDTAAAVRVAAFAASNLGEPARALSIIEENAARFGEALPADLRRLRADSLLRLGDVQAALREVDAVTNVTGHPADRLFRAELMVRIGDLRSSVPAVREALRAGALRPAHALRWAQILQDEEPDLSRQLWRHAIAEGLGDRLAVAAMDQAFQLGLDNEVAALMPTVHARAAAGSADVRMVGLDELAELVSDSRRAAAETEELYLKGAIPAHLFARGKAAAFLALYLGQREGEDGRLLLRLIRHGARPREMLFDQPWSDWIIHLDISGLLEASRQGLLDILERHPSPIRISPRVPALLMEMQRGAHATQRSRVEATQQIWDRIADGALGVAVQAPPDAMRVSIGGDEGEDYHDVRALITGLGHRGLLSAPEVEEKLRQAGGEASPDPLNLDAVARLRCDLGSLEQLATLDLLGTVLSNFDVTTDEASRSAVKLELDSNAEQDRLASLAGALRQRVADGIRSGVYQLLPPKDDHDDEDPGEDVEEGNLLIGELRDLLAAESVAGGVVWIDDRMVTGYPRTNTMPIIGVLEVLHELGRQGILDPGALRSKVEDLRRSGAALIPFSLEEVLVPLLAASVSNDRLIETGSLKVIRRSLAAAGRIERHLKIGDGEEGPRDRPDEIEYPRSVMRLLADALQAAWTRPTFDVRDCNARSDWLWSSIRSTQVNRVIPADDPQAGQDQFEVMQIAHCLDKALDIGGTRDEAKGRRLAYLHWVWERVIRQKAAVDATFVPRLAEYLGGFYRALLTQNRPGTSDRDRRMLDRLLLLRIQRLPEPVRDKVFRAPYFRGFVTTREGLTVGSVRFDPVRFWKAARTAVRYGSARLRTVSGKKVRVRRDGSGLLFTGAIRARLDEDLLGVVAAAGSRRVEILDRYLAGLDLNPAARNSVRAEALAAFEPHVLARCLVKAREDSPSGRYEQIADKLAQRRSFDSTLLHPLSTETLLHYLQLDTPDAAPVDVGAAFGRLASVLPPADALRRLWGIPVSIAPDQFGRMDTAELEGLAASARTPVAIAQLAAELRRRQGDTPLVAGLVERLLSVIGDYGRLLVSLLRWVEKVFNRSDGWRQAGAATKLALIWSHSDRLLDLIIASRSAIPELVAFFDEEAPPVSAPDLLVSRGLQADQAAPSLISPAALLYHCLGEVFRSDDVDDRMTEEAIARVHALLVTSVGDVLTPDVSLIMRRSDGRDAMGSFLRKRPVGLLSENLDPEQTRNVLVDGALDAIEAGGESALAAWPQLAAFATGGLSETQQARFAAVVPDLDLWGLAMAHDEPQLLRWRAVLAPMLVSDAPWVSRAIVELADKCHRHFSRRFPPVGEETRGTAAEALAELIEISALAAGAAVAGEELETFCNLLAAVVSRWPEAAVQLRTVADNLLAVTPAGRAVPLWELYLLLRSYD